MGTRSKKYYWLGDKVLMGFVLILPEKNQVEVNDILDSLVYCWLEGLKYIISCQLILHNTRWLFGTLTVTDEHLCVTERKLE